MRIAILHYTAPPVIGGVERIVGDQASALRALGHEVDVLTRSDAARWRTQPLPSYEAILVHNVFTMPFDLEWTRELRELAAGAPLIRWINWVHDVAAVNPHYAHLPWQTAEYALLREPPPNCIHVAVSEVRQGEYARASGLRLAEVRVIPNGIDIAAVLGLHRQVAALHLWQHDLVLFHPTRLIRRKNIELGLRVIAVLRAAGVDAVYVVTGAVDPHQADGMRYLGELKTLAGELGVARGVQFLGEEGPVSDAEVCSLYLAADALFLPSTSEGFGLPLLEALVHRLPIFCSDLPVHREVVGDAAHYFDAVGDPQGVATQLMDWAKTAVEIGRRRAVWREHDMFKICKERLEPLLVAGNETA